MDKNKFITRAKELNLNWDGSEFYNLQMLFDNDVIKIYKNTNKYNSTYSLKHCYERYCWDSDVVGYSCDGSFVLYLDYLGYKLKNQNVKCYSGYSTYCVKLKSEY